jgi:hypothetical protein
MELDLRLYLGTHCCSLAVMLMLEGLAPVLAGRWWIMPEDKALHHHTAELSEVHFHILSPTICAHGLADRLFALVLKMQAAVRIPPCSSQLAPHGASKACACQGAKQRQEPALLQSKRWHPVSCWKRHKACTSILGAPRPLSHVSQWRAASKAMRSHAARLVLALQARAYLCKRGDEGREEQALAAEPQRRSAACVSPLEPLHFALVVSETRRPVSMRTAASQLHSKEAVA